MTDPYAAIAETYDIMVDWPARLARERPFFAELFTEPPIRRALDVGCGTGHHTRLFTELGAEAIGIDPSTPMIERARALTTGRNPQFIEGGFADIPALDGKFDLIAILGNTLAYVVDADELMQTLSHIRRALTPGGKLCIQTVNYDSLLANGPRWLPLINRQVDGREYLFLREYRPLEQHVEFSLITLTRDGQWRQAVERSIHFPITAHTLRRALEAAGFAHYTLYGNYQREAYDPTTSPNLVAVVQNG